MEKADVAAISALRDPARNSPLSSSTINAVAQFQLGIDLMLSTCTRDTVGARTKSVGVDSAPSKGQSSR
jgi:hypothetical protein